ncbi:MAG: sensor histidine kinase [Myxococcales bacterium]|nr:MAG: sensor histidine kinase [Myxococcales bacterium]
MRLRIGTKMSVAVVLFALVGIIITATFAFNFYKEAILDEMENHAGQLSHVILAAMRDDMLHYKPEDLSTIINAVGMQRGVARVRVLTKDGLVSYSSELDETGTKLTKEDPTCQTCHAMPSSTRIAAMAKTRVFEDEDGRNYLSILQSIPNERTCWAAKCHRHAPETKMLGVLEVNLPLDQLQSLIREGRMRTALFALFAVFALSFMTIMIVRYLILRPVSKLVDATGRVAIGEWTDPISGGRQDELGDLIRSFNQMQERLHVSQRQLVLSGRLASVGKLAAGVAHEINNPLTGILTFAEDLYDTADSEDPRREDYQIIIRETIRCRQIVRELLDFARQSKPRMISLDINDVLARTVRLVNRLAQFQNCEIRMELQPRLPLIRGDDGQLQQVYLNLLVNAAESMPSGGKIMIRSTHQEGSPLVETEVSDTGVGMSDEQRQHIFEPFFTTKEARSHGLGLSVSWGIIEEHGGTIDVKSTPGEGTTFYISLPQARSAKRKVEMQDDKSQSGTNGEL